MTSAPRPRPTRPDYEQPYWEAARRHELLLQRCTRCQQLRYPFSPVCPDCLTEDADWIPASGRGSLCSWITFRQAFQPYFSDKVPYVVALVDLEEGPRLHANLVGADPATLAIGQPVEVTFEDVDDELSLPQFKPAGAR